LYIDVPTNNKICNSPQKLPSCATSDSYSFLLVKPITATSQS
jgi:hypothetical protein